MSRVERSPADDSSFVHKESLMVQGDTIPTLLKEYPQWVCWSYVFRGEGKKPDKRPLNARSRKNAGVHWRNTWASFEQAYTSYLSHREDGIAGIGLVLTHEDPFVAVDVDDCISEGAITGPAAEVVRVLKSYTEFSPSGRGLRIFTAAPDYQENHKSKSVEIYSHSRFVTITGQHVEGTPLEIATVDAGRLARLRPPQHATPARGTPPHEAKQFEETNAQLWEKIFTYDKFGQQHQRRFSGDISLDHGDHSLAVIRLLNTLARWTNGDPLRMRAMMLQSPLATDKWFSRRGECDYLDYQIYNAINYVQRGK